MGRISRQVMFMEMARAASRRSTCFRLNVGAIVTHRNNPISIGWNGQEPGAPHCAGNDCPGVVPGACGTIHAEINALKKAGALLPENSQVDIYCTHSPCDNCAHAIATDKLLHVDRVFFEIPYRDPKPLKNLWGICEVYEVTAAGYVVDYFTREVVELP
jgi:dCMP deaminase